MFKLGISAAMFAATTALIGAAPARAQTAAHPTPQCFLSRNWSGWKASPDSKSIYIRVGVNQVYRLDLSTSCPALQAPFAHLVTRQRGGSGWICRPLDLDLKVSDGRGFATPCLVSRITPLSAAEASSLPKKLKP
jgi:Family of unknown function (DUF6491)